MYIREETIEEENLDWGELTEASKENQDKLIEDMNEETAQDPVPQQKTIFLDNHGNSINTDPESTLKNAWSDLFKQNAGVSVLLGIVFVPYILGFAISYFLFYFYGGMSISNFLGVQAVPNTIELWSIGAYLFVTVGTVLAFLIP